jgi:hypothetical protein
MLENIASLERQARLLVPIDRPVITIVANESFVDAFRPAARSRSSIARQTPTHDRISVKFPRCNTPSRQEIRSKIQTNLLSEARDNEFDDSELPYWLTTLAWNRPTSGPATVMRTPPADSARARPPPCGRSFPGGIIGSTNAHKSSGTSPCDSESITTRDHHSPSRETPDEIHS